MTGRGKSTYAAPAYGQSVHLSLCINRGWLSIWSVDAFVNRLHVHDVINVRSRWQKMYGIFE